MQTNLNETKLSINVPIEKILPAVVGIVALFLGLWTALARLGWAVPTGTAIAASEHGQLMLAFIGTVIGLERAVASGRSWAYLAPWLSGLGAVFLLLNMPMQSAALAVFLGSLVLIALFNVFLQTQRTDFMLVMGAGVVCWAIGNAAWLLGVLIPKLVLWWAGFLILTIVGERLEMSRLRRRSALAQGTFHFLIVLYIVTLVLSMFVHSVALRLNGLVLVAMAMWLIRHDIARVTIKRPGLPRFAAFSMLSGYFWMMSAGLFALVWGNMEVDLRYDAWTHAQFLGFAFVMIIAHAPIILPSLAGVKVTFTRLFYGPLLLLQASLLVRIVADILVWWPGRLWAGMINVAAVLAFLGVLATQVIISNRQPGREKGYEKQT
jgi:hypothetical protein